jgi:hypothetical protein
MYTEVEAPRSRTLARLLAVPALAAASAASYAVHASLALADVCYTTLLRRHRRKLAALRS